MFKTSVDEFALTFMGSETAQDTREWLQQLKKPRTMTVQDFLARLRKLSDLIECMPTTSLGPPEVLAPPEISPKNS